MDKIDIRDLILRELKQNSVDENSSSNNKIIDNTDFEFIAESIVEKLPIYGVSQQRELLRFMEYLSTYWGIDEVIDCTKHLQVIEQYKP